MRRMRCDNITTHLRRARCRRGRDNAPELQDNHSIPHIPMRTGLPAVVLLVSALSRAHGFAPVMEIAPASAHGLTQADRSAVLPFARPKRKAQRRRARVHCRLSVAQGSTRGTLGGREQMLLLKAPISLRHSLFPLPMSAGTNNRDLPVLRPLGAIVTAVLAIFGLSRA